MTIGDTDSPGGSGKLVGSDRVLAILKELADHPEGIGLDEMARAVDSPKTTVHRALASLRRAGLAGQDRHGVYVLGDEFLRMAFAHHDSRPEHLRIAPVLRKLTDRFGETTHYAVLDGRAVVYRAKVDPPEGAVRLTSTVGGRNPAHVTAVGKLLLSRRLTSLSDVRTWVGRGTLEPRTENSICTAQGLHAALEEVRALGYAVDDQENEVGVNCVALPAYLGSPSEPSGAISISALAYRTPLARLLESIDEIDTIICAS